MTEARAIVKDEKTAEAPYFIYMESRYHGASGGAVRFNRRDSADRVAAAINRALETEGRLMMREDTA